MKNEKTPCCLKPACSRLYRVQAGCYSSREAALLAVKELRRLGYPAFLLGRFRED